MDSSGKDLLKVLPFNSNPASPDFNADLKFEGLDKETGEETKNYLTIRFFVMLADEISKADALPHVMEFKSTSLKAGQKILTKAYVQNKAVGLPPAASVFKISVSKQQNDKGSFAVFDSTFSRDSTKEEVAKCFDWFKMLSQGEAKVHDPEAE